MFNGYKRLAAQAPYWILPFAIGTFLRVPTPLTPNCYQPTVHTAGRSVTMSGRTARLGTLRCMVPIDPLDRLVTLHGLEQ